MNSNSNIQESVVSIADMITQKLSSVADRLPDEFNTDILTNISWSNESIRRAHLSIVDNRQGNGIYMLHCCIFPHLENNAPIFGIDIIAGKRLVTGFFHDFSPVVDNHEMVDWFGSYASNVGWKKQRNLPEWATNIFSEHIIAAGNVIDEVELQQIFDTSAQTLNYYVDNINRYDNMVTDITISHNYYCMNQKQNPRLFGSLGALGMKSDDIDKFVNTSLFPEL